MSRISQDIFTWLMQSFVSYQLGGVLHQLPAVRNVQYYVITTMLHPVTVLNESTWLQAHILSFSVFVKHNSYVLIICKTAVVNSVLLHWNMPLINRKTYVRCSVWTHKQTQRAQGLKYKINLFHKQKSKQSKLTKNTRVWLSCDGWALQFRQGWNNNTMISKRMPATLGRLSKVLNRKSLVTLGAQGSK